MKTLTNTVIEDFNKDTISVYFDMNNETYYANLSIGSYNFKIIDESFSHAFGIERGYSYEFDAKLYLTYLEDENGKISKIDEDVLESLKKMVLEEMQEQCPQEMYELFN